MLNVFQPALGKEELEAVSKVFQSNWVGKGSVTEQFEKEFASHVQTTRTNIRSVNCCTEGLFQILELLGVGEDDEVILPSISFVGAANAIASTGAKPIFCDVDLRTLNVTVDTIVPHLNEKTKAIILLHYGGVPVADIDQILKLANETETFVIEDSACSVASTYKGKACGTLGDFGVWSFDAMKVLVCGDGGMIYCKLPAWTEKIEKQLYLGMSSQSGFTNAKARWWEFDVNHFGRRSIMNDISSAIGLEQLKKLPEFVTQRNLVHYTYDELLKNVDWLTLPPKIPKDATSSYYMYWVQTDREETRDALALHLRDKGIYTTFRYYPLHLVKAYQSNSSCPEAERASEITLCLPIHASMSNTDIRDVVTAIHKFGESQ